VPQWTLLTLTSTHEFPHAVPPPGHKHVPSVQADPSGHVLPHMPQLKLFVIVSTQCAGEPQVDSPGPHVLQVLSMHTPPGPQPM